MKHKQPTPEELETQEQEAIMAAEELEGKQSIPEPEVVPEPPVEPIKEEPQAEPSKEIKEQLKKEVKEKTEKLSASAREAQRLYAKNRVITKALVDADEAPEPTEEELATEFKDWEVMSDVERGLAKETVISRNWRKTIYQAKEQATKIEKWNESVDQYVEDPQTLIDNPDLEGKTDDFKVFATKEENNSVPMKVLVGAFLHERSSKPKNKGAMFETGSGGPNEKPTPKSNKISVEEARQLRETNYNKYKELLMKDMIEMDF